MYMYAPTGLADALGQPAKPSLSPELRTWLKRVRAHPENFQMLLATATLDPLPTESHFWGNHNFTIGTRRHFLIDAILFAGVSQFDILDRLKRISADFQTRDRDWRRTIEDAVKLRGEYMNTLSVMGRRPEAFGSYIVTALLPSGSTETDAWKLAREGHSFVKEKFPPKLAERMLKTPAFDAHYYMVGRWLQRYGEVRRTKDPAFKRLVDEKLSLLKKKP
jgi:hypothetical protein